MKEKIKADADTSLAEEASKHACMSALLLLVLSLALHSNIFQLIKEFLHQPHYLGAKTKKEIAIFRQLLSITTVISIANRSILLIKKPKQGDG